MMHKMKMLAVDLKDEIEDGEHYAKLYTKYKTTDNELARTFHTLGKQELGHATALQEQMARFVREAEQKSPEHAQGIQAIWEMCLDWSADWMAHVRLMLDNG